MIHNKPYVHYKFIGVRPFTALLDEAGVRFVLFEDDPARRLYGTRPEYFNAADDSIAVGKCTQEGVEAYFAEFGIKITASFRSHIVFVYDHHPTFDDLLNSAEDIETLIRKSLDGVDLEDLKGSI